MIHTRHHIDHWRAWRSETPGFYVKGETEQEAREKLEQLIRAREEREEKMRAHPVFQETGS